MANNFYIAYGSNLSIEQMKVRTPDAQIFGTAILEGWQLLFRKYATIKKNPDFKTPVLVWKISERDEKNLDRYEGYPNFYKKKKLKISVKSLIGEDLGEKNAMVYIMTAKAMKNRSIIPIPSEYYYSILNEGYNKFGFDKKILRKALSESIKTLSINYQDNQPTTA